VVRVIVAACNDDISVAQGCCGGKTERGRETAANDAKLSVRNIEEFGGLCPGRDEHVSIW